MWEIDWWSPTFLAGMAVGMALLMMASAAMVAYLAAFSFMEEERVPATNEHPSADPRNTFTSSKHTFRL